MLKEEAAYRQDSEAYTEQCDEKMSSVYCTTWHRRPHIHVVWHQRNNSGGVYRILSRLGSTIGESSKFRSSRITRDQLENTMQYLLQPGRQILFSNLSIGGHPEWRHTTQFLYSRPEEDRTSDVEVGEDAVASLTSGGLSFESMGQRPNQDGGRQEGQDDYQGIYEEDDELANCAPAMVRQAWELRDVSNIDKLNTKPSKDRMIKILTRIIGDSWCSCVSDVDLLLTTNPEIASFQFHDKYASIVNTIMRQHKIAWMRNPFSVMAEEAFRNRQFFDDCDTPEESAQVVRYLCYFNNINITVFIDNVHSIINCNMPKINTLYFHGPPNSGKTLVALSIARACKYYCNMQDFNRTGNQFMWEPALHNRCILINEPCCDDTKIETFKNICEGQATSINVKFRPHETLSRTPIVITGNRSIACYTNDIGTNESALACRMIRYELQTCEALASFRKQLNPGLWHVLCQQVSDE